MTVESTFFIEEQAFVLAHADEEMDMEMGLPTSTLRAKSFHKGLPDLSRQLAAQCHITRRPVAGVLHGITCL